VPSSPADNTTTANVTAVTSLISDQFNSSTNLTAVAEANADNSTNTNVTEVSTNNSTSPNMTDPLIPAPEGSGNHIAKNFKA